MKKTLSIFLALVLMLSFPMISYAESGTAVSVGSEYTVTVAADKAGSAKFTFTPEESGVYKISGNLVSETQRYASAVVDVDCANTSFGESTFAKLNLLYNAPGEVSWSSSLYINEDCFAAKIGTTLNISIYTTYFASEDEAGLGHSKVTFTVSKVASLREVKMGESYAVIGEEEYFLLNPTENGIYDIWSYGCEYIRLRGTDGTVCEDYFDGEFPIDFAFEAKKDEIYLVYAVSAYAAADESSSMAIFNVVDGTKISPDVIEINGADDLTVIRNKTHAFPVDIYPVGAKYNCGNLEVKVGNEKIASAEYDADIGAVLVKGKRYGKTTLTVTDPKSGVTAEVEVEVVTRIIYLIKRAIAYISAFFESITIR